MTVMRDSIAGIAQYMGNLPAPMRRGSPLPVPKHRHNQPRKHKGLNKNLRSGSKRTRAIHSIRRDRQAVRTGSEIARPRPRTCLVERDPVGTCLDHDVVAAHLQAIGVEVGKTPDRLHATEIGDIMIRAKRTEVDHRVAAGCRHGRDRHRPRRRGRRQPGGRRMPLPLLQRQDRRTNLGNGRRVAGPPRNFRGGPDRHHE